MIQVATNGKPYDRRVLIDSRNLTIEIRGGRNGNQGEALASHYLSDAGFLQKC